MGFRDIMKTQERKEIYLKWIAVLRSGKYEQGTGFLCKDNQYCCLGVLCEELGKELGIQKYQHESNSNIVCYNGDVDYISDLNTIKKLNMDKSFKHSHIDSILMKMNDNGKTFDEIADYLEENLEKILKENK